MRLQSLETIQDQAACLLSVLYLALLAVRVQSSSICQHSAWHVLRVEQLG